MGAETVLEAVDMDSGWNWRWRALMRTGMPLARATMPNIFACAWVIDAGHEGVDSVDGGDVLVHAWVIDVGRKAVDEACGTIDKGRETVAGGHETVDEGCGVVDEGHETVDEGCHFIDESCDAFDKEDLVGPVGSPVASPGIGIS